MRICLVHITEMPEGFHDIWFSMVQQSFNKVLRADTKGVLKPIKRGLKGDNVLDFDNPYFALLDRVAIVEAFVEADREGFDAACVHCFGDPGVKEARAGVGLPIFGPAVSAMHFASQIGRRFAIIGTNMPGQLAQLEERVREHGLQDRLIPNGIRFDKEPFARGLWPHPDCTFKPAVRIAVEPFSAQVPRLRLVPDWEGLSPKELIEAIRHAGVVGLGGAAFPTHVKLSPPPDKKIDLILINGCECEPYLTTDHRTMAEYPARVHLGVRIMMRCLGVSRAVIGVERNKPDAIEALELTRPSDIDVRILPLTVKYPQGAEKMLIEAVTGLEVPSGKLPERGASLSGVQGCQDCREESALSHRENSDWRPIVFRNHQSFCSDNHFSITACPFLPIYGTRRMACLSFAISLMNSISKSLSQYNSSARKALNTFTGRALRSTLSIRHTNLASRALERIRAARHGVELSLTQPLHGLRVPGFHVGHVVQVADIEAVVSTEAAG